MREERRRVQLTGGSTLIVSLPIKWARAAGIKPGDELRIIQKDERSLIIALDKRAEKDNIAELRLSPEESLEDNFRYLIAYYLVGYEGIRLLSENGFDAEERRWIKDEVRKRLIGMEVVEEASNEILLQSFLKYKDFTLQDSIKSMAKIIRSMHEDALLALERGDENLAKDVIERDNEIDRFYLLTVRQLKASVEDPMLAASMGFRSMRDALGYRLIVKSMERVADHIEKIARHSLEMKGGIIGLEEIKEVGTLAIDAFMKSLEALSERDMRKANDVIREVNNITSMVEGVAEHVLKGQGSEVQKIHLWAVLESLRRIAEYSADISEITINLGIK